MRTFRELGKLIAIGLAIAAPLQTAPSSANPLHEGPEVGTGSFFEPDIGITTVATPSTAQINETITLVHTLLNSGPDAATNVQFEMILDPAFSSVVAAPSSGNCMVYDLGSIVGTLVNCTLGIIGPDGSGEVVITMTPTVLGTFNLVADTFLDETDLNSGDNQSSVAVAVVAEAPMADVELDMAAEELDPGVIAYDISIKNKGPAEAAVGFQTVFPEPFRQPTQMLDPDIPSSCAFSDFGSGGGLVLNCSIPKIASGSTWISDFTLLAPPGGTFQTRGLATSTPQDPNLINNRDSVSVTVSEATADLTARLTANKAKVTQGQKFALTATVHNLGWNDASEVTLEFYLPNASDGKFTVFVTSIPSKCSQSDSLITCNVGDLAVLAQEDFVVEAYAIGAGFVSASAYASATSPVDPSLFNNSTAATVRLQQPRTSGSNPETADGGDPVNMLTGEFFFDEPSDLVLRGPAGIRFDRMYGSAVSLDSTLRQPFGPNWTHSYNWGLIGEDDFAQVVTPRGRAFSFRAIGGSWTLIDPVDSGYSLTSSGDALSFAMSETGRVVVFDPAGLPSEIHHRGFQTSLAWTAGQLSKISDPFGNELSLQYTNGLVSSVSAGAETITYSYTNGLLTAVAFPGGVDLSYEYDEAHNLNGLMTSRLVPSGASHTSQVYDTEGRVTTQRDALGATTRIEYGADVTTVTDPDGLTNVYSHDAIGQLVRVTLRDGTSVEVSNAEGRRTGAVSAVGTFSRALDPLSGLPTRLTSEGGEAVQIDYASLSVAGAPVYMPSSVTWPDGTSSSYTYDASGRITRAVLPGGGAFEYAYGAGGLLSSYTNPLGGTVSFTYNANGTVSSAQDESGSVTSFEYDVAGRRVRTTFADGSSRLWSYDSAGRISSETDESGATTLYSYDANGNVVTITDPTEAATSFTYDALDRPLSMTDPAGFTASVTYDQMGNVSTSTNRSGGTTTYSYDELGRLISFVRPDASGISVTRNSAGAMTSLQTASGATLQTTFDAAGLATGLTTAASRTTSLSRDTLGKLTGVTDPAGGAAGIVRNAFGSISALTLPGGIQASYTINAWGQVTQVADPLGAVRARSYDEGGRLSSWSSPDGRQWSLSYNSRGHVDRVDGPAGSSQRSFDPVGRVTSETSPGGETRTFSYDEAGRLTGSGAISFTLDARGSVTGASGFSGSRDAQERLKSFTWPGGQALVYERDALGRLTSVTDWAGGSVTFAYSPDGRLERIERPNGVTTIYTRDEDGLIVGISETSPAGVLASSNLQRDPLGNVTQADRVLPVEVNRVGRTTSNSFDPDGRAAGFAYDLSGRRTSDDQRNYGWDEAGRLGSAGSSFFTYDEFGHQVSGPGVTLETSYLHEVAVAVTERAPDIVWRYVFTPEGHPLYRVSDADSSRQFFHFDEAGNSTILSNGTGAAIASWMFDPYGVIIGQSGPDSGNPYLFAGAYGARALGESGLYRMGLRVYDAETASFLSPEALRDLTDPQALDSYTYGAQNPLRFVDPIGTGPQSTSRGASLNDGLVSGAGTLAAGSSWANTEANGYGSQGPLVIVEWWEGTRGYGDAAETLKSRAAAAAQGATRFSVAGDVRGGTGATTLAKSARTAVSQLGIVGDAAMILDIGLVGPEARGRFDKVVSGHSRAVNQAALDYEAALNALVRSYELRKITREELRERRAAVEKLKNDRLEAARSSYLTDARIEAARLGIESLEAILPIPFVSIGSGSQAIGASIFGTPVVR